MKIALFTDGIYPYVIGGMQKHSYNLVKYLAKNQIHVDLYHTNQSDFDILQLDLFSEEEKIYIRPFVIEFPHLGSFPGHYIKESFEYSRKIFELFKKNSNVDFIYVKGFSGWKLIDEKRKGYICAPVGVNFHGYEMFQNAPTIRSKFEQLFLLQKPVMFNVRYSDYVFSYGGKISEIILKLGIKRECIVEIPTGIEKIWLNNNILETLGKRKFIFIGRYERRKGVEELNKALKSLIGKYEFEFHFVGAIPGRKRISDSNIIYHGIITDTEKIKSILRRCDVLVCPSHSEGMPNVILEAMASGLAIIASDVGAVNRMVSVRNGLLINEPGPDELTKAIKNMILLKDAGLSALKNASVKIVSYNFIWDNLIKKTIRKINDLINQQK